MVRQADIAKRCGVSISAVSAAFKRPRQISRDLREKILSAAQDMGYMNKIMDTVNIGLYVPHLTSYYHDGFYGEIICGILQRCTELGCKVHIYEHLPESYYDICEIQGFIAFGQTADITNSELFRHKMPYVVVGCPKASVSSHRIYFDNSKGVRQLTEYVLTCNHRRIAIINGQRDPDDVTWNRYLTTVTDVLDEHGLDSDEALRVYQADYGDVQTVEIAINRILAEDVRPTCVMCTNDVFAYIAYRVFRKNGFSVPDDISVTGFDGITIPRFMENPSPRLTTVYGNRVAVGRSSVDLILRVSARAGRDYVSVALDTELSIGDSVKRI